MDAMLECTRITPHDPDYAKVASLYDEAFPPVEQFDLEMLNDLALRDGVDFLAYYDRGEFVGLTYSSVCANYFHVLYLAVEAPMRSRGLGSRILAQLAEAYPDCISALVIEPLDPDAPNQDQRLARVQFYERNGYSFTGYNLVAPKMTYAVLSNSSAFDPDDFVASVNAITPEFFYGEEIQRA